MHPEGTGRDSLGSRPWADAGLLGCRHAPPVPRTRSAPRSHNLWRARATGGETPKGPRRPRCRRPMIRRLSWLMALALSLGARAADPSPYTPPADLAGPWAFTPDPRLPNVLILGDSISLGYTR